MANTDDEESEYEWGLEFIEKWLPTVKSRSRSTRTSEIKQFDQWAKSKDINEIGDITLETAAKFVNFQQSAGYSASTISGRVYAILKMLDYAYKHKYLDSNPLREHRESSFKDQLEEWEVHTKKTKREKLLEDNGLKEGVSYDEYTLLRNNVPSPKTRNIAIVDLLFYTGMRAAELAKVTVDMLDQENRLIRNHPDLKKETEPDATRTSKYHHNCDLPLQAWLNEREKYACIREAEKIGEFAPEDGEPNPSEVDRWLFCSRKTAPIYPDRINKIVVQSAENAGIQDSLGSDANGKDINYINAHSLRHGHGTWAIDEVGVHRVQEQLGHTSADLTESKYIHTDPDDPDNAYHDLMDE